MSTPRVPAEVDNAVPYEVCESRRFQGHWHAEQIRPDGTIRLAIFSGEQAELLARQYADWKNARPILLKSQPCPFCKGTGSVAPGPPPEPRTLEQAEREYAEAVAPDTAAAVLAAWAEEIREMRGKAE